MTCLCYDTIGAGGPGGATDDIARLRDDHVKL